MKLKFPEISSITVDFAGIGLVALQFGIWMHNTNAGVGMGLLLVLLYNFYKENQMEVWQREKLRHEALKAIMDLFFSKVEIHKHEVSSGSKKQDSTDLSH